jgi:hypothetical protein
MDQYKEDLEAWAKKYNVPANSKAAKSVAKDSKVEKEKGAKVDKKKKDEKEDKKKDAKSKSPEKDKKSVGKKAKK